MTLTDDALVHELRERADATLPQMGLRPDDVLAAGRRYRRRRTALRTVGTVAAVAAVAFAGGELAGVGPWDPTPVPPARVDQAPRPFGDAQTVELVPGVIAANRPVEMRFDEPRMLSLGIDVPHDPDTSSPLRLVPMNDAHLAEVSTPDSAWDGGVQFLKFFGDVVMEPIAAPFTWNNAATPDDEDFRWDTVMRVGGEESGLFVGVLPAWLPDPRVVLYSTDGFRQADGSVVHGLEVPLYPAPTDDGRLLYTVWIPAVADDRDGFATDVTASLAIGSDGAVVPGQRCATLTLDECAEAFGPGLYEAAERAPEDRADRQDDFAGHVEVFTADEGHELRFDGQVMIDVGLEEVVPLVPDAPDGEVARLVLVPTDTPYTGESVPTEATGPYTEDFVPYFTVQLRPLSSRGLGEPILEFGWPRDLETNNEFDRLQPAWSIGSADGIYFVTGAMPADATEAIVRVGDSPLRLPTFTTPTLEGGALYVIAVRSADRGPDAEPLGITVEYSDAYGGVGSTRSPLTPTQ